MRVRAALVLLGLASSIAAQSALLRRDGNLVPVPVERTGAEAAVRRLIAGPTPAEAADGVATAIPVGTRLVAFATRASTATITLSEEFGRAFSEDAVEQVVKTALHDGGIDSVHIRVARDDGVTVDLDTWLGARAPLPPAQAALPQAQAPLAAAAFGALAGRTIAISPGHGYYWHSTLGWTTQRGNIGGLTEDIHTNEIAMRYLMPALANLGARVFSCRERGETPNEAIGDDDQGSPVFETTGGWTTSPSAGYGGGGYRFATTTATPTATATWTLPIPSDGMHPVYVFHRGSANRIVGARFHIEHSGGTDTVLVDQTRDDRRWVHLGDFWFTAAAGARITLDNQSANPGPVVIADAVRVGAGVGSIPRGTGTSGQRRWLECSRYWAEFAGAPASVWDVPGLPDNSDDVTTRPKYSEWRGADAFLSLHTNAGGGTGTESYIHDTAPTAGSAALRNAIHTALIDAIRSQYHATWVDRGVRSANFGEVRELQTMPGTLIELAFHDDPAKIDHRALHDPRFRELTSLAMARGVLEYFAPGTPPPPGRPEALRVTQDGNRGLRVAWATVAAATGYSIEQSDNGKGFVEVAQTNATSWSTGALPHGTVRSFRVRAFNPTGRSFPTEVLSAGTSHTMDTELLLVQGFDRRGRFVKGPDNTRDYLRLHADAIRRHGEFSLGFDAASNEAVIRGDVVLTDYRAVDWALGEESTVDETFSETEQALVTAYVTAGGRMLVTGSEVGWDLWANGSPADRAFYGSVLGAAYVQDDAGTYGFTGFDRIFATLPPGTFDDGTGGTYNVDYPDVIGPFDGDSVVDLVYDNGMPAGIERDFGGLRTVVLGFPLETVVDPDLRSDMMARALRFLLTPRSLEAPALAPLFGAAISVDVHLPGEPGAPFVILPSAGLGTTPLPGGEILPLVPDGVLFASLNPGNGLFQGFAGVLDVNGNASGVVTIPPIPALFGLCLYYSGFTLTPGAQVRTVFEWARSCTG